MSSVFFQDLMLNANKMNVVQSSGKNSLACIRGSITIQADAQFCSSAGADDANCHYDFLVEAALTGDAERTITVNHYETIKSPRCPNVIRFAGENSAYAGKWAVRNYNKANTLEGMVMSVESMTALGSDPTSMVANSIWLYYNGALAIAAGLCADGPFAPANRGITIGEPGGRLTTISNETWSTAMPITGNYPLTKGGAGRVVLEGDYTAGNIVVEQGVLRFGKGFAALKGMPSVTVQDEAAFEVAASKNGAIANFSIPVHTTFVVPLDLENGTAETVVLDSSVTLPDGKVRISFDRELALDTKSEAEFPLLTVPASVRELTPEDIENASPQNEYRLPKVTFTVKDNASGVQTVYATIHQVVSRNPDATSDGSKWWTNTKEYGGIYLWDDEQPAHDGADYLINGASAIVLRASQEGKQIAKDFDFPGESLTFWNVGTLAMKCRRMTFKNLCLGAERQVNASGCGEEMQYVAGDVTLLGALGSKPVNFDGTRTQGLTLEADCHGTGTIQMRVSENANIGEYTNVWTAITGDNSDFSGKIILYSKFGNALTNGISCKFDAPENLGGPMAVRTYDGIWIRNNSSLSPTQSMTLDTTNRGIYTDFGRLDIPEAVTLTVSQPLSLDGTLVKEGKGTLVLSTPTYFGKSFSEDPAGNNVFDVRAGGVKVATIDAMKSLNTAFHQDGFLVVDPEVTDDLVKDYGLFVRNHDGVGLAIPDGVLNVKVDVSESYLKSHVDCSVPICTVSSEIADTLRGKIKMVRMKGYSGTVSEETLTDGEYAGFVRFTMTVAHKGMMIIFR